MAKSAPSSSAAIPQWSRVPQGEEVIPAASRERKGPLPSNNDWQNQPLSIQWCMEEFDEDPGEEHEVIISRREVVRVSKEAAIKKKKKKKKKKSRLKETSSPVAGTSSSDSQVRIPHS